MYIYFPNHQCKMLMEKKYCIQTIAELGGLHVITYK